jgi:HSP20 family protein
MIVSERPFGTFSRQLFLGESLDAEHMSAKYTDGVLRLEIPVAEQAKPRKVEIKTGDSQPAAITV